MRKGLFLLLLLLSVTGIEAKVVKGKVKDRQSGEEIIGATIVVKEDPSKGTVSGLDGSFTLTLKDNAGTLICSYIGYKNVEYKLSGKEHDYDIEIILDSVIEELNEIVVTGINHGRTENAARDIEKRAMNVVNVMSAKAIELSPDLTVANVIQRMSGVTVERSSTGEGQYAILRGMDKRYNYTLVNGVKIPSPDNKNRFVPLDIFPSELLDRLEVTKSLTANMEGDGIGGAVNLIMKDAPNERKFSINLSTGYNSLFFDRDFLSFNHSAITKKSPNEIHGTDYAVTMDDFTSANLHMKSKTALPDLVAGISYGDRFFYDKLGIILAGNFQNNKRGKESDIYYQPGSNYTGITDRFFSEVQTRLGAHAKFDYHINSRNKLMWYNGYINMRSSQIRDAVNPEWETIRMRYNRQYIVSSTLKGEHSLLRSNALKLNWSAILSKAYNETPDNAEIELTTAKSGLQTVAINHGATRRWEHNSDRDKAGYLDLSYHWNLCNHSSLDISTGGMYRNKKRDSYFNSYTFKPIADQRTQVRGEDWTNFDEIKFEVKRFGNLSDPLNYDATEKIGAGYGMAKYTYGKLELITGVRVEHTNQGYELKFTTEGARNIGNQKYVDVLPDFHLKYTVHKNANLRFSYARAINRPSFFEIVPYNIINEEYKEKGNPDLQRTISDNIDLRYEYFPRSSEQFMIGAFYKRIQDPIEYGLKISGQDVYYMPDNFGTAHNSGVEVDVIKYFNWIGIKANYTYTHSRIKTPKTLLIPNPDPNAETNTVTTTVEQKRPLFGQAAHVANFSLLFKETKHGWDGQIAFGYTGKRMVSISRYYNNDIWEDGYVKLDTSIEKSFKCGLCLFAKASNLLNTPLIRYTPCNQQNETLSKEIERHKSGVTERKEHYGQSILVGVRFKL